MFIEILVNLFSFNLGYFVDLALTNLFWVFVLLSGSFFVSRGKNVLLNFFVITFLLLSFVDFLNAHDLVFYTAGSLVLLYLTRLAVLTFVESGLKKPNLLPLAYSLVTYSVLIVYNFFLL